MRMLNREKFRHDNSGERSPLLPDINITKLAVAIDVNRSHLSRVLNGSHTAGRVLLWKLKEGLGFESVEEVDKWLKRLIRKHNAR